MFDGDVAGGRGLLEIKAGAERVEPGVQFHPPLVGLGHGEGQRVVKRGGGRPIGLSSIPDHGSIPDS